MMPAQKVRAGLRLVLSSCCCSWLVCGLRLLEHGWDKKTEREDVSQSRQDSVLFPHLAREAVGYKTPGLKRFESR